MPCLLPLLQEKPGAATAKVLIRISGQVPGRYCTQLTDRMRDGGKLQRDDSGRVQLLLHYCII